MSNINNNATNIKNIKPKKTNEKNPYVLWLNYSP